MILVTGGAGFIGSNLVNHLSKSKKTQIVSVDWKNKENSDYFNCDSILKVSPKNLHNFLKKNHKSIELIIHLGAITSTVEKNVRLIVENNINLSIFLWDWCVKKKKRFIYASSAATYGNGENDFIDNDSSNYLSELLPLNVYGWSKHIVDKFVANKTKMNITPAQCVGLKFFNVYGPNENHKGEMRSIALKIYQKIKKKSEVRLFKSHNPEYKDGEQLRDFIYVKDVVDIICWFAENAKIDGLFNVGSGQPRSFKDLAKAVFKNCNAEQKIKYVNTPNNIRKQYQYFTKANIQKLRNAGFKKKFLSLEEGVTDYIRNHLNNE